MWRAIRSLVAATEYMNPNVTFLMKLLQHKLNSRKTIGFYRNGKKKLAHFNFICFFFMFLVLILQHTRLPFLSDGSGCLSTQMISQKMKIKKKENFLRLEMCQACTLIFESNTYLIWGGRTKKKQRTSCCVAFELCLNYFCSSGYYFHDKMVFIRFRFELGTTFFCQLATLTNTFSLN